MRRLTVLGVTVFAAAAGASGSACSSGGIDCSTLGPLSPGNHSFAFAAHGSGGSYYATDGVVIPVTAGQDELQNVNVPAATPTTASAEVRWTFPNGKSCADVGVDHVYVYFDPPATGSWTNAQVADTACAGMGGAVTELQIVDVPDGLHTFAIQATRG